jgi:hypothetical protein
MPTIVTKSEFARMRGVNPSSVTRWAREGRIVLTADGRVAVEPSIERLRATEYNDGVADRWREYRRAKRGEAPRKSAPKPRSWGELEAEFLAQTEYLERYLAGK